MLLAAEHSVELEQQAQPAAASNTSTDNHNNSPKHHQPSATPRALAGLGLGESSLLVPAVRQQPHTGGGTHLVPPSSSPAHSPSLHGEGEDIEGTADGEGAGRHDAPDGVGAPGAASAGPHRLRPRAPAVHQASESESVDDTPQTTTTTGSGRAAAMLHAQQQVQAQAQQQSTQQQPLPSAGSKRLLELGPRYACVRRHTHT